MRELSRDQILVFQVSSWEVICVLIIALMSRHNIYGPMHKLLGVSLHSYLSALGVVDV